MYSCRKGREAFGAKIAQGTNSFHAGVQHTTSISCSKWSMLTFEFSFSWGLKGATLDVAGV